MLTKYLLFILLLSLPFFATAHSKTITNLKPTIILISIDGFQKDFLNRLPVPHLLNLAQQGSYAPLISVFPSLTFPNHYSIVTGLYPKNHGIMLNEFLASDIKEPFTHQGHAPTVTNPDWWLGEPIWVTAQKQGQYTSSAFWPGSAVNKNKPTYLVTFFEDGKPQQRVNQILSWLDLPASKRPTLLMLYFENIDNAGHKFGPDSIQVRDAARSIDNAIGNLQFGLKERGIENAIDIIIVSDHGMTSVDPKKIIDLNQFLPKKEIAAITNEGAIVGVYPKPGKLNHIYRILKQIHAPIHTYLGSALPQSFHYNNPKRTPPIIVVAEEHAFILGNDKKVERGTHGYDPLLNSMQGIFIGYGPAFKSHYHRSAFKNIHIYSLLSYILHLKAANNDGSLLNDIFF